ncbi:Triacylglycerol lipase [Metarhizium album ARSEF 1941]|uniref:Triacylglycerol lipase n=1 Tax=Metarhizium album (strain ARSEF 1941) TaxID=1081103 RepID=A0A0B2X3K5_METAS|nr:Triacylglycerol lipase [Metarhizium album ARSEF 1941]KHO00308.1 Triacylglycerol lipase [Metarhizium album ARSEF 1941]
MRLPRASKSTSICLLALVSAAPVLSAPTPVAPVAPWPTDGKTLAIIDKYSYYAAAAYCRKLNDDSVNNLVCVNRTPGYCGQLAGAVTVHQFHANDSIAGYVAVSRAEREIIAGFRGTASISDIFKDLQVRLKDPKKSLAERAMASQAVGAVPPLALPGDTDPVLPLCEPCRVHAGFWDAFRGIKDALKETIQEQLRRHPGYQVKVTGHSLGGAVASIAAGYLRKSGIPADVYTYGSPRVGDPAFAAFISGQENGTTTRVTNGHDPVTAVIGIFAGYAHTTPEYWFPKRVEEPKNVNICVGVQNTSCSGRFFPNVFYVRDHSSVNYAKGFDACPEQAKESESLPDFTEADVEEWKDRGLVDDVDQVNARGL